MAPRPIVRHPEVLDGRWHLEGTDITVAAIRQSYLYGYTESNETFRYAELSQEEVEAALRFEFPAIRQESVELRPAMLQANCVCGESTTTITTGDAETEIVCVCGRSWYVGVVVEPGPTSLSRSG